MESYSLDDKLCLTVSISYGIVRRPIHSHETFRVAYTIRVIHLSITVYLFNLCEMCQIHGGHAV